MIQEEDDRSRIYDYDLARELSSLFASAADASRAELVNALRAAADGFSRDEA